MRSKYHTSKLGIWTLVANDSTFLVAGWPYSIRDAFRQLWTSAKRVLTTPKGQLENTTEAIETRMIEYLYIFMKEIYFLGPLWFLALIFVNILEAAVGALRAYFLSRILDLITQCLQSHQFTPVPIVKALAGRVVLSGISAYISRFEEDISVLLGERVRYHFLERAMYKITNFDVSTAEDPAVRNKIGSIKWELADRTSDATLAFLGIKDMLAGFLIILSELSLLVSVSRKHSSLLLSVPFCFGRSLLSLVRGGLYSRSFVSFCNSSHFVRMASLHRLAFNEAYQEDRLNNDLGRHIVNEFKKARRSLGNVCTEPVQFQWLRNQPVSLDAFLDLSGDSSLLFLALRVLWDHSSISLSEFILVQQVSQTIHGTSWSLVYHLSKIYQRLQIIRDLYTLEDIQNKIKDGDVSYPRHSNQENHNGAEIEFRNVSFRYPGADKNALTNVSFKIKPGQVVVIVGVNGSGKSSSVKLLTRLYDPSSGEIFLDGLPLTSYKLSDIRRAMTILRQDHPVLPLSLRENVAFGLPGRDITDDEIEEAIRSGGADKFVRKLKDGLGTVLNPVKTVTTNFVDGTDPELKAMIDGKEPKTDLSGGETQRLSASRTFMRLKGGSIRLLVADEPTSALDPEGEYELFSRLRQHSIGKTAIFITHRFGHLTKHADLILCMKDGCLVEQGSHEVLMALDGEYKKLYNIQAKAFVSG